MDYGFGANNVETIVCEIRKVLILVLMDYGFGACYSGVTLLNVIVLILVLMDYGFGASQKQHKSQNH